MNITEQQIKTIKAKQLRRIIREAIEEVLNEAGTAMVTTKSGTKAVSFINPTELSSLKSDSNVSSITTSSGQKIKEADIDEMARIAGGYKMGDTSKFNDAKEVYSVGLQADVLKAIEDAGDAGATQKELEVKLKKDGPTLNAILNKFKAIGVLAGGKLAKAEKPAKQSPEEKEDFGTEFDDFYATDIEDEAPEEAPTIASDKEIEKLAVDKDVDMSKSSEINKALGIISTLSDKIQAMKKGPDRDKKMAALKQYVNNNKNLLRGRDINQLTKGLIG